MNLIDNGITVEGKPLKEYLRVKERSEIDPEVNKEFKASLTKATHYHPPIIKRKEYKERNGNVVLLTQRQINKEYWRTIMTTATTVTDLIISLLLSGNEFTSSEIEEKIIEQCPDKKGKLNVPSLMSRLKKRPIGKILKREWRQDPGRKKQLVWSMFDIALDIPLEEFKLLKGRTPSKKNQEVFLSKYPWLSMCFEDDSKTEPTETESYEDKVEPLEELQKEGIENTLHKAVKRSIQEILGINVNVTGEIKITFGFDK